MSRLLENVSLPPRSSPFFHRSASVSTSTEGNLFKNRSLCYLNSRRQIRIYGMYVQGLVTSMMRCFALDNAGVLRQKRQKSKALNAFIVSISDYTVRLCACGVASDFFNLCAWGVYVCRTWSIHIWVCEEGCNVATDVWWVGHAPPIIVCFYTHILGKACHNYI